MGEFCWFECNSHNQPAAEKFYSTLVSGTAMASPESPFPYTILSCGGHPMMGMMETDATFQSDVPAHWMGYIAVADLDAACDNVPALGGTALCDSMDIPGIGRTAYFTDPNGAPFALWQPPKARGCCSSGGCGCG